MVGAASAIAVLAGFVLPAAACRCPDGPVSLEQLLQRRPDVAVLAGRVAAVVSDGQGPTVLRIVVDEVIAGDLPPVLELTGATFRDDPCGLDVRVGEVRTVAVTKNPDGRWSASACLQPIP